MHGSLDPDEKVMAESEAQLENHLAAKRKAIAVCNQGVVTKLYDVIAELGWDCYDNVAVEIGGTSVYEIDGAGTKWAPVKGTRKYNKDAFIVIKNLDRNPTVPSQPNPDLVAHHLKPEVAKVKVAGQELAIQQDEKAIAAALKKSDDEKGYDTYSK